MQGQQAHILGLIPRLRRLAVALVHDRDTADTLVQMCLGNVSDKYGHWVATVDVRVPLFECLVEAYLASNWHASRRRAAEKEAPTAPDPRYAPLEAFEDALRRLGKKEKAAFLLINLEETSYEDAAAIMGEHLKRVRALVRLAQNKLRHSVSTDSNATSHRGGRSDAIDREGP